MVAWNVLARMLLLERGLANMAIGCFGLKKLNSVSGVFSAFLIFSCTCLFGASNVLALDAIIIGPEQDRLEITKLVEFVEGRGDRLQIDTARGADGIASRMSVDAHASW